MEDSTYNGWKNYETWAVGLYLDGNYDGEGTYREVLDLAQEAEDVHELAGTLEDFVREVAEPEEASLASDLIGAALSEVDWHELATSKLQEVQEAAAR